jgi:mRNA interferase YafQ
MKAHGEKLNTMIDNFLASLIMDNPLPRKYLDHPLSGELSGLRECHLKPDLLLLYTATKIDEEHIFLTLADIGSHALIFR